MGAVARRKISTDTAPSTSYFASGADKDNLQFVSSGCALMDCALGGGFVLGRVANIVGDRSSGKTLLAMEICTNFAIKYPEGWIRYAESEAAFDLEYAEALGAPVDRIIFNDNPDLNNIRKRKKKKVDDGDEDDDVPTKPAAVGAPMETVEDWQADMEYHLNKYPKRPGLYIVDSLDALSDEAEQGRDFDEGSYGGTKPKQIGKIFRTLATQLEAQNVLLVVISQIRDKLNVTFGETKTRSGGKALDFYASHIVWLAEIQKMDKTIDGIKRIIGVKVEAYVKKNKVGLPFRRAKYPILFGYGIDDMTACVEWLVEIKRTELLSDLKLTAAGYKVRLASIRDKGGAEAREMRTKLGEIVRKEWARVETTYLPKSKKY